MKLKTALQLSSVTGVVAFPSGKIAAVHVLCGDIEMPGEQSRVLGYPAPITVMDRLKTLSLEQVWGFEQKLNAILQPSITI